MDIRSHVKVDLFDAQVSLPVNMSLIETIERVYDCNINYAVVALQNPAQVKLSQLAEVYLSWLTSSNMEQLGVTRVKVREYVYTADIDTIDRLTGAVMGAVLHFRRAIIGDDMDKLAQGRNLDDEPTEEEKKS